MSVNATPPVPVLVPVRSARLTRGSWALAATFVVMSLVGTAFSPFLLVEAPLLLVALSPDPRHVAFAAATVPPLPLIAVGVVRRALFQFAAFGLGVAYGPAAIRFVEQRATRLGGLVRFVERLLGRYGAPLLVLVPLPSVTLLAAASGQSFAVVVPALLVGNTLWVAVSYFVGDWLSDWSAPVIEFLSRHLVATTAISVALVVGYQLVARLRARRRDADQPRLKTQ